MKTNITLNCELCTRKIHPDDNFEIEFFDLDNNKITRLEAYKLSALKFTSRYACDVCLNTPT